MFHVPMRFEEASEMIEARQDTATAMTTRQIAAAWSGEARQRAFFSARVAEVSILKELHRVCTQVVEGKMSPKQATRLVQDYFVGEGADALARLGFAPPRTQRGISELGSTARLMLIFNTNLKLAQETGHYRQWSQVKEVFPYGIWHCGNAKEHRKEHLARDGRAFPFNHPIWTVSPPGGEFNCHCWREVVSAEELERRGITPEGEGFKFEPSSLGFDPSRSLDEQPIPPPADLPPGIREQAERKLAEEEARRKAEEARCAAEEAARKAAEEEARRQAEEAARRNAEEEARRQAEEARQAEEEAKRKAAEAKKAEEEARRRAAEAEVAKHTAEEEARKAEEKARRQAEEEARKAQEEVPPQPEDARKDAGDAATHRTAEVPAAPTPEKIPDEFPAGKEGASRKIVDAEPKNRAMGEPGQDDTERSAKVKDVREDGKVQGGDATVPDDETASEDVSDLRLSPGHVEVAQEIKDNRKYAPAVKQVSSIVRQMLGTEGIPANLRFEQMSEVYVRKHPGKLGYCEPMGNGPDGRPMFRIVVRPGQPFPLLAVLHETVHALRRAGVVRDAEWGKVGEAVKLTRTYERFRENCRQEKQYGGKEMDEIITRAVTWGWLAEAAKNDKLIFALMVDIARDKNYSTSVWQGYSPDFGEYHFGDSTLKEAIATMTQKTGKRGLFSWIRALFSDDKGEKKSGHFEGWSPEVIAAWKEENEKCLREHGMTLPKYLAMVQEQGWNDPNRKEPDM